MKAGSFYSAALALLQLASCEHNHLRHQHFHQKRDVVKYEYTTAYAYTTVYDVAVVVYVDEAGNPVSTVTGPYTAVKTQAYTYTTVNPPASAIPTPDSYNAVAISYEDSYVSLPAPAAASPASPAAVSPAQASGGYGAAPASQAPPSPAASPYTAPAAAGSGYGIAYSPYRADGTCKSKDQVSSDFTKLTGYGSVRIYGTDCDQAANVFAAARSNGIKVFAGIFDINQVQAEAQKIIQAANGDWSIIDTISVGNEVVNSGKASPGAVTAAIGTARGILRGAGYNGPVVTVDTFVAIIAHPELCQASDFAAANCHAFFDGGVEASGAGQFVLNQAQRVSQACGGKKTVITESGWPSQGGTNNKAVPSKANQDAAINSLRNSFASNLFLYTAFNDMWKTDNGATFGCEKFYGLL